MTELIVGTVTAFIGTVVLIILITWRGNRRSAYGLSYIFSLLFGVATIFPEPGLSMLFPVTFVWFILIDEPNEWSATLSTLGTCTIFSVLPGSAVWFGLRRRPFAIFLGLATIAVIVTSWIILGDTFISVR